MAAIDHAAAFVRERVEKLASQRGILEQASQQLKHVNGAVVGNARSRAEHLNGAAQFEPHAPLKAALSAYALSLQHSAAALEHVSAEHVDKKVLAALGVYDRLRCVRDGFSVRVLALRE
jgi:hypothetical protein